MHPQPLLSLLPHAPPRPERCPVAHRLNLLSPCGQYRYILWREWEPLFNDKVLMVIGLNPSTAEGDDLPDPTITRLIDFGKRWGMGALLMTNLFAWRDTLPADMKRAREPVGPDNDRWLCTAAGAATMILAAWGVHGRHHLRADRVAAMPCFAGRLQSLGTNGDGSPCHPLYLPKTSVLAPFSMPVPNLI